SLEHHPQHHLDAAQTTCLHLRSDREIQRYRYFRERPDSCRHASDSVPIQSLDIACNTRHLGTSLRTDQTSAHRMAWDCFVSSASLRNRTAARCVSDSCCFGFVCVED